MMPVSSSTALRSRGARIGSGGAATQAARSLLIWPPTRHPLPPPQAVAQDPLEVLLGAQRLAALDRSERDLRELCGGGELCGEEERARCWETFEYFTSRRRGAQAGCVRELQRDGGPGRSCQDFDRLERLVQELMAVGRVRGLYSVLKVEADLAKRGGAAPPPPPPPPEVAAHAAHMERLRARAGELFDSMDAGGRGFLDREGFLSAMARLRGEGELGWEEADLGTVFEAIDCHSHVTREQFADILVAEELRDPSADAELLRHLRHARPEWWSDLPPAVGTL